MVIFKDFQNITNRVEPWWTFVGAPIIQETIFRFVPYQFLYVPFGLYWEVGIMSSILFAVIHWYFGKWFVMYSFLWGLIFWWVMLQYGLFATILIHAILNFFHLSFSVIKK